MQVNKQFQSHLGVKCKIHSRNIISNRQKSAYRRVQAYAKGPQFDIILSSGWLGFALHAGFLQEVIKADIQVQGVMGTSSGAISGSMWAAGYAPEQIAEELSSYPAIDMARFSWRPWAGGAMSLHPAIERLRTLLPPTFEDLDLDFAVGVVDSEGNHRVIDSGPLPEAVIASAAVPFVFTCVDVPGVPGGPFKDGGMRDRVGLKGWRDRKRRLAKKNKTSTIPPALVHLLDRTTTISNVDSIAQSGESNVSVVRSPRSNQSLFGYKDFDIQMQGASERSAPVIAQAVKEYQEIMQQVSSNQ